jgi:lysophospholipase L1-like esterase
MNRGLPPAPRWAAVAIAVLAVAVAVLAVIAYRDSSASERSGAAPATTEAAAPTAPILTLPGPGASVLFFGDSYTQGYGAEPEENGYAYLVAADFGWVPTIDAVSGTGYLDPGPNGEGTYLERMAQLPDVAPELVILQGGLNDQDMTPTGPAVDDAAGQVVAAVRARYPGAQIVLFGPVAPTGTPSRELVTVNSALHRVADDEGLPWISPITRRWDLAGRLIADQIHPDTEGHRYLADQLSQSLRDLAS